MRKKAFTLVELLVVISVIAMLMGILLPVLNKARSAGKSTVCKANLHSFVMAFRMYLDDNRSVMPPAAFQPYDEASTGQTYQGSPPIIKFLGQYLSVPGSELAQIANKKVYCKALSCPADRKLSEENGVKSPNYGIPQYWYKIETSSYWYNAALGNHRADGGDPNNPLKLLGIGPADLSLINDYENFHGKKGTRGSYIYLYIDGHIGDGSRQN